MKIIDISWPLSEQSTAYKDRSVIKFQPTKEFEKDNARETLITLGSHSGTHVDAPSHFLRDGKTIDEISLGKLIGQALVLDLSLVKDKITHDVLVPFDAEITEGMIILLKTSNSLHWPTDKFVPEFIFLAHDAAVYLVSKKVKAVGIDYLGIERGQVGHLTHKELLSHDIPIIEGLRLEDAHHGRYLLCCLPLLVVGIDGAPARAILMEEDQ